MAQRQERTELIRAINEAFGAANIAATAQRLSPLRPTADFIEICHTLGLLAPIIRTDLRSYRQELTMPPLTRRIMTVAFRASLLSRPSPTPLHIDIRDGKAEAVKVTAEPNLISVELTRTKPAVAARK